MKPDYHVPSMREVEKVRGTNGLTVVSTFSGCGGSCLGFEMAGYDIRYAVEFVPAAQEVYKLNHPDPYLDTRDVRTIKPEEILERLGMERGELDVLEGSPPCSAFSTAGQRAKGWGSVKKYSDTKQERVEDLFFEYARLLEGLMPRAFVAENVAGLVKGVAKGYFIEILRALKGIGYKVEARVLDSQWLGVPQKRQRLIFVGVREDVGRRPAFPSPLPHTYSLREACPWMRLEAGQMIVIGDPRHKQKPGNTFPRGLEVGLDRVAPILTACGMHAAARNNVRLLNVPDEDGASHRKRTFSIRELKRLQSFPDDFALTGTYDQKWERMGRSVPPLMMRAVAETLRDEVLSCAG